MVRLLSGYGEVDVFAAVRVIRKGRCSEKEQALARTGTREADWLKPAVASDLVGMGALQRLGPLSQS